MRPVTISIRTARPEDADEAIGVVRSAITHSCIADHRKDAATLSRWLANKTAENFRTWIANEENFCLVAEADDRIAGVGLLHRSGELRLVYLAPAWQRQGIGGEIVRALESQASRWGLSEIRVGSTQGARAFYAALGYSSTGPAQAVFGVLLSHPYAKRLAPRPGTST